MKAWFLGLGALALSFNLAWAAPVGQFTDHGDIGNPKHPGDAEYDGTRYRVTGGGSNMWAARDDLHFAWKKMSGDVVATTDLVFHSPSPKPGAPGYVHRKGGIVLRQDLDTDSAYVDALRMGNQQLSLQYRETKGGQTHLIWINTDRQDSVRLEKAGDYVYLWVPGPEGKLRHAGGSFKLKITGSYYIGLGVCPHDNDVTETMDFSNVNIGPRRKRPKTPEEATLQTMQATNPWEQTVLVTMPGRLTNAAWTRDGKYLVFNNGGAGYSVSADGGEPEKAAAASAPKTAPPGERWNELVLQSGGSIWSPHVSPDGKWLLYLAAKGTSPPKRGDMEVRLLPLTDGAPDVEKVKTMARFYGGADSLDLSPWSPDSKNFAFVSYRHD